MSPKLKSLLVLLVIFVSLVPIYLLNRYLQHRIQPKKSFARLVAYVGGFLLFIFGYTFFIVWLIGRLFAKA